jgi:choline dehydrogenase-like flavoprotein
MVSNTEVQRIESSDDVSTVYATHLGKQKEYRTKKLILCGGAFGSTHLLFKSGFKKDFPSLGGKFSTHPQFMFFGIYDEVINAHKNMFQSVASKDPSFRSKGFKLENVFAGPPSIAMLYTGFGADHLEYMKNYTKITCAEVALRDENAGQISIDKRGKLIVDKPLTDLDRKRMTDGTGILKQILAASGAKRVIESPMYFGLHLMGGCRMGVDPNDSVVEPDFRVRGHKNVYVCDSSIFPNAPGINPALTIMALAHKLSQQLIGSKN